MDQSCAEEVTTKSGVIAVALRAPGKENHPRLSCWQLSLVEPRFPLPDVPMLASGRFLVQLRSFATMNVYLGTAKKRLIRLRGFTSFCLVAAAQFLSPAAAADPASKIDPPAWAYRHSKEELQAYGARATADEPEKKSTPVMREARLRRILDGKSPSL